MQIARFLLFFIFFLIVLLPGVAQETLDTITKQEVKKGWNAMIFPTSGYDIDVGIKYGGFVSFYNYGTGENFPRYDHHIYLELSNTTKNSGVAQLIFDSEALIPGIRFTGEISYLTEKALDFYGFNGAEVVFNDAFIDDSRGDDGYISRMYYKHDRKFLRLKSDFQGPITGRTFRWFAGFAHYGIETSPAGIEQMNKGKTAAEKLPDTNTLFENYIEWGIIPKNQASGGNTEMLRGGIIYDTRDNEPNPQKGLWDEFLIYAASGVSGNTNYNFIKLILNHRHYMTLVDRRLTLAYRLSYQPTVFGDIPVYMLPFVFNSFSQDNGLGGKRTLRGVIRNRLVGEDYGFGNLEMRYIFRRAYIFNQYVYFAGSGFLDAGAVTKRYEYNTQEVPSALYDDHFTGQQEYLHVSAGVGGHVSINQNFIFSFYFGVPFYDNDGKLGIYTTMGFLF